MFERPGYSVAILPRNGRTKPRGWCFAARTASIDEFSSIIYVFGTKRRNGARYSNSARRRSRGEASGRQRDSTGRLSSTPKRSRCSGRKGNSDLERATKFDANSLQRRFVWCRVRVEEQPVCWISGNKAKGRLDVVNVYDAAKSLLFDVIAF